MLHRYDMTPSLRTGARYASLFSILATSIVRRSVYADVLNDMGFLSFRTSVRLSNAVTVSKQTIKSKLLHHLIGPSLQFIKPKDVTKLGR